MLEGPETGIKLMDQLAAAEQVENYTTFFTPLARIFSAGPAFPRTRATPMNALRAREQRQRAPLSRKAAVPGSSALLISRGETAKNLILASNPVESIRLNLG